MNIKSSLAKLANHLDNKGLYKEADYLDQIIKSAQTAVDNQARKEYFDSLFGRISSSIAGRTFKKSDKYSGSEVLEIEGGVPDGMTYSSVISGERFGGIFGLADGGRLFLQCQYVDGVMSAAEITISYGGFVTPLVWNDTLKVFEKHEAHGAASAANMKPFVGGIFGDPRLWINAMRNAPELV
jgi:hypothetical protein